MMMCLKANTVPLRENFMNFWSDIVWILSSDPWIMGVCYVISATEIDGLELEPLQNKVQELVEF